jgi:TrmH family RNA methyltransferase
MGATFRIPLLRRAAPVLCTTLRELGMPIFTADARVGLEYTAAPLGPPVALVIGNESAGPDPIWVAHGMSIRIPLLGPIESLNAAVAAAILLYEVARHRKLAS